MIHSVSTFLTTTALSCRDIFQTFEMQIQLGYIVCCKFIYCCKSTILL